MEEILTLARCLLVLDNLESITDPRFYEFLGNIPAPSKALVTTRTRIEESQRNLRLSAMSREDARALLAELAIDLDAGQLIDASPEELDRLTDRVGGIPLALKLAAGRISGGLPTSSYVSRLEAGTAQEDILEFCFSDSWNELDPDMRKILAVIVLFSEPPSEEEIRRVSGLVEAGVEEALATLIRRAFLNRQFDLIRQAYEYSVLPLTADFVQRQLTSDQLLESELRDNHNTYLADKGRYEEVLEQISPLIASTGQIPEKERLSNMLVEAAFRTYQEGDYQGAMSRLENARSYSETGYLYYTWRVIERDE